jgi:glycosyltransferase involved in cell wall biosynthesis
MNTPFVSILIPTYNREKLIAESIQSALDQDYDNFEVVVVDNASTDGTWEQIQRIASADARVRAFRNESNLGPVRNWIECARNARGTFSKILWSDDLIASDFISSTLPLFDENVGFVYTGVRIFGSKRSNNYYMRGATGCFPSCEYIAAALHGWNVPYSPGCVILRTADLQRFLVADIPNRMRSNFSQHAIGNDLFLLLMVANNYPKVGFVNRPISAFRDHHGSISASAEPGKLSLHYGMAKAYFAQIGNLDPGTIRRLDTALLVELWHFKNNPFGFREIQDFYPADHHSRLNPLLLVEHFLKRALRLAQRFFASA